MARKTPTCTSAEPLARLIATSSALPITDALFTLATTRHPVRVPGCLCEGYNVSGSVVSFSSMSNLQIHEVVLSQRVLTAAEISAGRWLFDRRPWTVVAGYLRSSWSVV